MEIFGKVLILTDQRPATVLLRTLCLNQEFVGEIES